MIPAPFRYHRPESIEEALSLLGSEEDAKLLAGGHSLIPLMKLRLSVPSALIDIGALGELDYIREADGEIAIGAMTRHHRLATSALLARSVPLLAHAAGEVGDPQVRHRGTIGGSVVHGDPASDLPAVVLALDGRLILSGPNGKRSIAAKDFFLGFLETAVAPDEILTEIRVSDSYSSFGFEKFTRRAQDWAIVGVAVARQGDTANVALVNMASTPIRATGVEGALQSGVSVEEAAGHVAAGTDPVSDQNASSEYRRELAEVLVRRALVQAGW